MKLIIAIINETFINPNNGIKIDDTIIAPMAEPNKSELYDEEAISLIV